MSDDMKPESGPLEAGVSGQVRPFRCGYAVILGRPNVGKSTLLNALLGQKLAITTPRPQTTRHRIMGVVTGAGYQVIFFDTPGLFRPSYELQSMMVKTALETMKQADVILYVIDASRPQMQCDPAIIGEFAKMAKPVLLIANKVDIVAKNLLLPLIDAYRRLFAFADFIPVSALQQDGLEQVLSALVSRLPQGGPLYPDETLTDRPERFFSGELIREAIFTEFQEEIPYSTAVTVIEFKPRNKIYIRAEITVERPSQKAILIGQRGEALKRIGRLSREKIEAFLGSPVYLDLWIKVRPGWRNSAREVRNLEYGQEM